MRKPLRGGALAKCIKLCKHCCWQVEKKDDRSPSEYTGAYLWGECRWDFRAARLAELPVDEQRVLRRIPPNCTHNPFSCSTWRSISKKGGVGKKKMETRNDWKKHDGQTQKINIWTDIYWKCTFDLEKEKTRILNYSWVYSISPNCNLRVFGLTSELHLVFVSIGINVFVLEDEETSASPFSTSFE